MTDRIVKVYYPLPRFPPISFSSQCSLSCLHCQGYYLHFMKTLHTPKDLFHFAQTLVEEKGTGFLVSGGFTQEGTLLNLEHMLPALAHIKRSTHLLMALHTGFVDPSLAQKIHQAGIDVACPQVIGDTDTIRKIMGLSATPQDYAHTLHNLSQAGIAISPHVCAGLYQGKLYGEKRAFQIIKDSCTPETLVITTLCPTRGTPLESIPPLTPDKLEYIIKMAQSQLPRVKLALGCMRPRNRRLEIRALDAGITRFANPSKNLLRYAQQQGYTVRVFASCCGIPQSLDHLTSTSLPPMKTL